MSNTPGPSRFTFDTVTGALLVSSSGGGGGAVNITQILSNPVALSNPLPVELSDGTNPFGTPSNPLSVNVISGGGSNASVGATGATAPASATEIGIVDAAGNLQNVSAATPLPVSLTSTAITGTVATVPGNPQDLTVLEEMLMELRIMRKLLMMVYEESGQGNPTSLLDDPIETTQTDYNIQ